MFRASNVVSLSIRVRGGANTLKAYDIICSSKTTSAAKQTVVHIKSILSSPVCPVQAWRLYYELVSPPPSGPAFIQVNGSPMAAGPVVSAMRAALKAAGYINVNRYSMHSLRRGATRLVSTLGAPSKGIMERNMVFGPPDWGCPLRQPCL